MSFIFRTENGDLIVQGENPGLPETMSSTYLNDEVTLLRMHKPVRHVYTWDQEIKARQIRFTILIFDDFFTIVDPLSDTVFEFTGARKVLLSNVRLNSDTNEIDYEIMVLGENGAFYDSLELFETDVVDIVRLNCNHEELIFYLSKDGTLRRAARDNDRLKVQELDLPMIKQIRALSCYLCVLTDDYEVLIMPNKFDPDVSLIMAPKFRDSEREFYNEEFLPGKFYLINLPPISKISVDQMKIAAMTFDGRVYYWGSPMFMEDRRFSALSVQLDCQDVIVISSKVYFTTSEGLFLLDKYLEGNYVVVNLYLFTGQDTRILFDS